MVKYPLILGVIALVAGLLLALVYNITAPIIENNANKRENAVILEIFGDDVEINNISDELNKSDQNKGLKNAYTVKSAGKEYYVYKITIKDGVGSDDSSAIVALRNGKIYTFKLTSIGDDYARKYDSDNYVNGIENKGSLTNGDVVSGSTLTGVYVVDVINAAIAHYGRVK
jgi:Na+-translocating ferredoxin:NAD+ oxidoreductase RnfG subunit